MSGTQRRRDPGLIALLRSEPWRFELFQALRLLERHRVGPLRLRSSVSLAFPASQIESAQPWPPSTGMLTDGAPAPGLALTQCVIGLLGPLGVLPRHYTDSVAERERNHRDDAGHAFLDLFSHRAAWLLYQAWRHGRPELAYERDRHTGLLPLLRALAGCGLVAQQRAAEPALPAPVPGYYAGLLRHRPVSAGALASLMSDYFDVPVRVESFCGQWVAVPEDAQTRIGLSNAVLGGEAFCGARYWDRSAGVRLRVGPLSRVQFEAFLPGSGAARAFAEFMRLTIGDHLSCELRLILARSEPAGVTLGRGTARLGWCGWLATRPARGDREDSAYLIDLRTRAPKGD